MYLSFYGNRIGLLTIGGFYKKITDLIYLRSGHVILDPPRRGSDQTYVGYSIVRPANNPNETPSAASSANGRRTSSGFPRRSTDWCQPQLRAHLVETDFPRSYVRQERTPVFPFLLTTVVDTFRTGTMPDQASDIANFSGV